MRSGSALATFEVVRVSVSDVSRPSETNRADSTNHGKRPSKAESLKLPLTEQDGIALREDVRDFGNLEGARPLSWRESVHRWREYIEDTADTDAVFQNTETGEYYAGSTPHRFDPDYADKQYAKLKDLERGLSRDYGKRLHTAMLTLTASSCPDDEALPPVDHLLELDSSWESVRRELSRQLEGTRWEYLAILEPHKSGYLHIHIAVFVDGVVRRDTFAPVIEAHVRNCDIAGPDAHDTGDDSTISVRHAGGDRSSLLDDDDSRESIGELAIYLAEYLGTYGDDPLDASDNQQMANAVLWATGKQRWRPSNGAQSYMAAYPSSDDETEWELVGVRSGTEYYPAVSSGGGVDRFETSTRVPDRPDPPPKP